MYFALSADKPNVDRCCGKNSQVMVHRQLWLLVCIKGGGEVIAPEVGMVQKFCAVCSNAVLAKVAFAGLKFLLQFYFVKKNFTCGSC